MYVKRADYKKSGTNTQKAYKSPLGQVKLNANAGKTFFISLPHPEFSFSPAQILAV